METKLLHGDCLELLKTLPDCSVDAVITDPPYGLSNSVRDSLSDIFIPTLIDVFFPKFNNAIAKACGSINLGRPLDRVSFLNQVNRAFWEETRVGMPESSIDFDSDIVDWNEEVKHTDKPAVTIPNRELPDVLDAHRLNNGNRFFLKLRACVNSSLGDSAAVGISEFGFGRLTVFVVIPFNSCFACFLRALSPRDSSGLADIIRLLNDPQAFSKSPASVVTGRGTELRAVLSFDVRNGTCEIKPASGTRKVDAVFEFVCPESIGTITGASSLSSMFKPHSVSFIDSTANGAFSVCFHSFIVPHINRETSGFMGKKWDCSVPGVEVWVECLRVLKPGGHLLAFAGTRTQHRMAVNIEDAGFEIRDMIAWVHGQGLPKGNGLLKPTIEPITVARKRCIGSIKQNAQKYGTGVLNIESCRIEATGAKQRWPANLIHDGSEIATSIFSETEKNSRVGKRNVGHDDYSANNSKHCYNGGWKKSKHNRVEAHFDDFGSAARFFYCAKASVADRNEGLPREEGNTHPTVKPTDLMRYLCRLVMPPGGTVLDPFMGSGSTGKAAVLEGFSFIGIEREAEYIEIARARIGHAEDKCKNQ